jgi:hypothetical protein
LAARFTSINKLHERICAPHGLHRLLSGAHPLTRERLGASSARIRVAGYDLTFRAPKSVSLLYGLGAPGVAASVREAHERAIAEAMGYVKRQAAIVSRGHARECQELASGVVAAAVPASHEPCWRSVVAYPRANWSACS